MIKKVNILILLTLALGASFPGMSFSATPTISITSASTTYPAGTTSITFTATTSPGVSAISFYYGTTSTDPTTITTYIDTVTNGTCSASACTFTYTWDSVPAGAFFYVDAVIGGGGSAGAGTSNGVIDKVLGLDDNVPSQPMTFSYTYTNSQGNPTTVSEQNPAADPNFGPGTISSCSSAGANPDTLPTQLGDDQMCLGTYPYNGSSSAELYGTCEWTGGSGSGSLSLPNGAGNGTATMTFCSGTPVTPSLTGASTVDSLDETMHILSHFDIFAQNILNKDMGTINSTFDSWYSQAAGWIAPACASSTCDASASFDQTCTTGSDGKMVANPCNPYCVSSVSTPSSDTICNMGSPGRLLSIYDPVGYPGVANVATNATQVDELKAWETLITSWLNKSYTPADSTSSNLWCVPTESTASGLQVLKNDVTVPTAEDTYIKTNAPSSSWGDLSHVIACLNYNASSTPAGSNPNASNYQACLSALMAPGACSNGVPYQCAAASPPTSLSANDCDPYYIDQTTGTLSYAGWLNSQINFGAAKSYQACLSALTSGKACTASGDTLPEACEPWFLGRDLISSTKEAEPIFQADKVSTTKCVKQSFSGPPVSCVQTPANKLTCICTTTNTDITCDPTYSDPSTGAPSYAKWVKDSMTLFTNEEPKFALRSAFLTDIYNRAQTMQNIFGQGDTALHNFFKPCDGCADGSKCGANVAGVCNDGSRCGAPSCGAGGTCQSNGTCNDGSGSKCNYCAYGGPAAQLIYAKSLANPVRQLPNSVIYGWTDQTLPNGQTLPGTPSGNPGGYAHIIKVTAYSAGRDAGGPPGVQPVLPWIHSWNTFLYQYYTLANRDGNVYVSVQRWDQDHANATTFPNGHELWQFLFHKPSAPASTITGNSLFTACTSFYPDSGVDLASPIGFGLQNLTVQGLANQSAFKNTNDKEALSSAFMLNDNGDGTVDPNAANGGKSCADSPGNSGYCQCLEQVVTLLNSGMESHSCARYTAAVNGHDPSGTGDSDYSLKFIDCASMEQGEPPASSP